MKKIIFSAIAIFFFLSGCGSNKSTTIGSGVDATTQVLNYLNLVDVLMPSASTRTTTPESTNRAAFGAAWDTVGTFSMSHPKYDGTGSCSAYNVNVSFKDWMGYQFDKSAARCNGSSINIFGRVKNSMGVFCAISYTLGSTGSSAAIPAGTSTITFSATTKSNITSACGIDMSNIADNSTATLVVSHPTGGSYDTKFSITFSSGRDAQDIFATFTSTSAKMASNESNSNGTNRTLVSLDTSTKLLMAEYISRNTSGGVYIHRLYADQANDLARIISQESGATSDYRRYSVTGKPDSSSELNVALSADANGNITNPQYTGNFDREACVNKNTGAIITDGPTVSSNAFTCGTVSGVTVDAATGLDSVTSATAASGWQALTSSTALSWSTIDNMLTSSL